MNQKLRKINEKLSGQVNTLTMQLEVSRLEFIQIFDAVSDPVWVVDNNNTILRVNSTFVDLFKLENKEAAVGKNCCDILNNCLCRKDNCPLEYAKEKGERIEKETTLKIKNKKNVPFLLTTDPLFGIINETIGAVVQFKNISERKAHEEALKETNKILEGLARLDGLTQIPNRRIFDETLEHEWLRMKRSQLPISLLMIDIDFFKLYNDNYGHAQGDECLKQIAYTIDCCVRRSQDLAARYGGEEFCCILPDTDLKGAVTIADSILNTIRDCKIPHEFSNAANIVTVSIGCSCMIPDKKDGYSELLADADQLLYKSKESGRNKITNCFGQ